MSNSLQKEKGRRNLHEGDGASDKERSFSSFPL